MERTISIDNGLVRNALERAGSGFLLAGPVLGAIGAEGLERFTARVRQEWTQPGQPNTELRDLGQRLDEAGVEEVDARSHLRSVPSEEEQSVIDHASIIVDEPEALSHITQPHGNPSPDADRPGADTSIDVKEVGVEAAKRSISVSRWLAGKAISVARQAVTRNKTVDAEVLRELHATPEEKELVHKVTTHFGNIPAINNWMTALVYQVGDEENGPLTPEGVEARVVTMLSESTDLTPQQARFAVSLDGPQMLLH